MTKSQSCIIFVWGAPTETGGIGADPQCPLVATGLRSRWGGGVRKAGVPSPEKKTILYIKIAIFNALWALFRTVPLHVFQTRSSALGSRELLLRACREQTTPKQERRNKCVIQWNLTSLKTNSFESQGQYSVTLCYGSPQLSQFDPTYCRSLLLPYLCHTPGCGTHK